MPLRLRQTEAGSPSYLPALDGLRALAILLVIPHNVSLLDPPVAAFYFPFIVWANLGWIGVQLFFVLSGFLITGQLLDSRMAPNYFQSFFARRILRIFPLYYAVLIAAFAILPLLHALPDEMRKTLPQQVWLWTFLVNWTQPFGSSVEGFSHFWSLAVEEQFYLVWPFIVHRRNAPQLALLCMVLVLAAIVIRTAMVANGVRYEAVYEFTICRIDALALGGIAATLVRIPAARRLLTDAAGRFYLYAAILLCMTGLSTRLYSTSDPICEVIGYTMLALAFTLMVLAAYLPSAGATAAIGRALGMAPLRLIGKYSYAMYVFHLPLHLFVGLQLLKKITPAVTPAIALIYTVSITAACFLAAAASYHLFELHFLRLKQYFVPQTA